MTKEQLIEKIKEADFERDRLFVILTKEDSDKNWKTLRFCTGFNSFELLGVSTKLQQDVALQMAGQIPNEMTERLLSEEAIAGKDRARRDD